MEILERARGHEAAGRDIVHMEIGEPDFPTPPAIIRAAQQHLATGMALGYTPAGGLPALREAISGYYQDRFGVAPDPRRIFLTPGASGALTLVLGLMVDAGDEILVADPGYPCYPNFILLAGGVPKALPVGVGTSFNLTAAQISETWSLNTRGVLLASPSNPTGTVMPRKTLEEVIQTVESRRGFVISDEIYHGLEYGETAISALALSDQSFVINSFSKYFGMTGWRLGWAVVPEWAVDAAERLAQNLFISAPTLSQYAALCAFSSENREELEHRREAFAQRRELLLHGLRDLGFGLSARADGAFYVYADSSRFASDSEAFARGLLDEAGVAVTPGTDFGMHGAQNHIRFAYTASIPRIHEALSRIQNFLQR
jgi:aspartate/methionine/tyrosine aminotransferase